MSVKFTPDQLNRSGIRSVSETKVYSLHPEYGTVPGSGPLPLTDDTPAKYIPTHKGVTVDGKKPRKKAEQREHHEQVAFFNWLAVKHPNLPAFAVPNAGKRGPAVAAAALAEGLFSGVPDIIIPRPAGLFCGLAVEMKVKGGKVSDSQRAWGERLTMEGWRWEVCWGLEEAQGVVDDYLSPSQPTALTMALSELYEEIAQQAHSNSRGYGFVMLSDIEKLFTSRGVSL